MKTKIKRRLLDKTLRWKKVFRHVWRLSLRSAMPSFESFSIRCVKPLTGRQTAHIVVLIQQNQISIRNRNVGPGKLEKTVCFLFFFFFKMIFVSLVFIGKVPREIDDSLQPFLYVFQAQIQPNSSVKCLWNPFWHSQEKGVWGFESKSVHICSFKKWTEH